MWELNKARIDTILISEVAGPILVGFSGGLDSTVLLHALAMQPSCRANGLRAIHVDHDLHPNADRWAETCRVFCDSLNVELTIAHVQVTHNGKGLEASARDARYAAIAEHLRDNEILALAHHQDDQAETILLRLLRASGSEGLAAMQPMRAFAKGSLWRPLLPVPRSALVNYAHGHGLTWIEDPSNEDERFDRNFLRHRVLPLLTERWPHTVTSLARSAELLAEDAELLREEVGKRLAQAQQIDSSMLSVATLLDYEKPWRARVLRQWLSELGLPPLPGKAVELIQSQLLHARPDAQPEYRWAGTRLRRWRDLLHVETVQPSLPKNWKIQWDGKETLILPTGDRLSWLPVGAMAIATAVPIDTAVAVAIAIAPTTFMVRARKGGERITLPGRDHSHALKQVLLDLGIPPWQRERLPLIFSADGELLAAGDKIISARLEQLQRERKMQLRWERQ